MQWSADTRLPQHVTAECRVLERFGVPFLRFDRSLRCVSLSPAAAHCLGLDEHTGSTRRVTFGHAPMLTRLVALIDRFAGSTERETAHGAPHSVELTPSCGASVWWPNREAEEDMILVVLHPLPPHGPHGVALCPLERHGLTPRERQVAKLVSGGRSTKEVAAALGVSVHTARHHTERVFGKLGVHGRVELTRLLLAGSGSREVPDVA